jgi:predicted TIM-barrel fold metal-dependent hydrolase
VKEAAMARQYTLMSADGHLEVPPERWTHRVPEKYRDRAPRMVRLPNGGDAQMIEGQPLLEANFLDLRAGRAPGTWQPFGLKVADAAGTGPAEQRVNEQDVDGLDAEVLFPAMVAGPVFWRNISHDEVYKAVVRAYNDWLAEEYCAVAPDRLIGMGVMPITNVEDAIAEMAHCKKIGLKGVQLGALPNGQGYPTPEDDRFWAAALDMDMPLTVHVAFNRTGPRAAQPTLRYPKEIPEIMQRLRRPFLEWICNFGLPPSVSVAQLVLSGVFERFPRLKIFFAETRLGWVPFWLEHADLWYQRHLGWAEEQLGFNRLKELPSHYVREHVYFSVQYEKVAVEERHHVGVDRIMFATDFPHIENEWPNSRPIIDQIYAGIPEDEKHRIWAGNAVDYFKLA